MKEFDLNHQWDLYLQRVGLKGKKVPAVQYREMKRTFYGAAGQFLMLLTNELAELPEDEAATHLHDMINQVGNFFLQETNRSN